MKSVYSFVLCGVVAVLGVAYYTAGPTYAVAEFKKAFAKKYVKESPATEQEKALAEAVKEANCGVCHLGEKGKDKKKRNSYGTALSKLIKKDDKKDDEKIEKALDDVAKEHSKADDAKSPTFGDLIKDGKLPGEDSK